MTHWVLDIETTTDFKTVRMVGIGRGGDTAHLTALYANADGVRDFIQNEVEKGDTVWTWNGVKFDLPVLREVWGLDLESEFPDIQFHDAMIFAKMIFPDMLGGHSLDNFSKKYCRIYKPWKPDDVSWYNTCNDAHLAAYLKKDLEYTLEVVHGLQLDAVQYGGKWEHALKVEKRVRELTNEQAAKGVLFDTDAARRLWDELNDTAKAIEKDLEDWLPILPVAKPHMAPKKQFRQDGTVSALMEKYCEKHELLILPTGEVTNGMGWTEKLPIECCPQEERLTLGQQAELKQWLMSIGWTPTWWNTKDEDGKKVNTSPRLNHKISKDPCPNLAKLGPEGEQVTRWLMLRSRRSLLANESFSTGLIVRAESNNNIIPSDGDTCGTNTARWRHKGIVNIPRPSTEYGKELRDLFIARPGYAWVGWDAASLEACIEAHYVFPYDPDYAKTLVTGSSADGTDIHTRNMNEIGLPNRDKAKTFKYAITYGAQPPSLAQQLGVSKSEASDFYDNFWDVNFGLKALRDDLVKEWKHYGKKYIVGLDGRLIATRSEHSLINAKFQSGGAIVMKHAMLIANKSIKAYAEAEGIEAYGLIRYHDEEQWEVTETDHFVDQLNTIGELGVDSITKAGKFLKLNVPLSGEYAIGKSWAETH